MDENYSSPFLLLQLGYETDRDYYIQICSLAIVDRSLVIYLSEVVNLLILVFYRRGIKKGEELTLSGRAYNLTKELLNNVCTYTLHLKSIGIHKLITTAVTS